LVVVVALLTAASAGVAPLAAAQDDGPPVPPHRFYGTVSDADGDAVSGVTVEVTYDGEVLASDTTDSDGYYDLNVPQENGIEDGDSVELSVQDSTQTETWEPAGATEVDFDGVEAPDDEPDDGDDEPDDGEDQPDDGDGGTGGGGGGVAAGGGGTDNVSETATLENGEASLGLAGGTGLNSVSVTIPGATGEVTVTELLELPAGVDAPPQGRSILEMDISGPDPSGSEMATVRITVSQTLLNAFNAEPEELLIVHYTDGEWEPLETSVVSEDPVVLEGQLEGFSTFAVVQADQPTTATPTATPEPTDTATATPEPTDTATPEPADTDTPEPTTTSTQLPGFGPLVALVALLALGAVALRRRE
jgi:PGF-pre-PGF domain-containing protein/PGF-CTERM protein